MKHSRAKTKKCRKKTSDLDLLGTSTHARKLSVREMSVRSFSNDDGDGNENVKKSNRFIEQNNNYARASRFFVHFFAVTARLRRENA